MSYDSFETSVEAGQPVECFRFIAGGLQRFYTSAEDEVSIAAQAYTPTAIGRADKADGPDERDADFRVRVPTTNDIAQMFIGTLPGVRVRLTVFRFHRLDTPTPEVVVVFEGHVAGAGFENGMKEAVLTCRQGLASSGRQIPPRTYQSACNHELYNPLTCKRDPTLPVNQAAARTVLAQVGNVLTVDDLGAYAPGWFTSGFVEVVGGTDYRAILEDDGAGNLTLLMPFVSMPALVNVFAGCDHTSGGAGGCALKHANIPNFGGTLQTPTKNPFESGID